MGKERRKRTSRPKPSPTGLPSLKDFEIELDGPTGIESSKSSSVIQSLCEKLQSVTPEHREVACCTILSLLADDKSVESLLNAELVKIILCLLQDSVVDVKKSAAGILRNLSAHSENACEFLVSHDVMTALVTSLNQYGSSFVPKKTADGKFDGNAESFLQLIHLTWNLCEVSDVALDILNKSGIVNILSQCLDVDKYEYEISIAAAQCLYSISEDNANCAEILCQPAIIQSLQEILKLAVSHNSILQFKTLVAGIILNVAESKDKTSVPPFLPLIFNVLVETLSLDLKALTIELAALLKSGEHSKVEASQTEAYKTKKDDFDNIRYAQQLALEILTNLCNYNDDDDNENWEDVSSGDADDLAVDDDSAMDCSDAKSNNEVCNIEFISSEVHEAILSQKLPSRLIQLTSLLEKDVVEYMMSNSFGQVIMKGFVKLSVRTYLCLHNFISSLSIQDLGGTSSLFQTWLKLADQTLSPEKLMNDIDLLEAQSSVLRALLMKLAQEKQSLCEHFASSNLEMIVNAINQHIQNHQFGMSSRVNIIRTLGIIGTILIGDLGSNLAVSSSLVKIIGRILLDVLNKDQELWIFAEAIDTIFDLFAEDYTKDIEQEICVVERLKSILPILKSKVKMQRKSLGSHVSIIMTAKENLPQFIQYKINSYKHVGNGSNF